MPRTIIPHSPGAGERRARAAEVARAALLIALMLAAFALAGTLDTGDREWMEADAALCEQARAELAARCGEGE